MRRENNGRWMMVMFVLASLVAPGVVAAGQQQAAPDTQAAIASPMSSLVAPPGEDPTNFNLEIMATPPAALLCSDPCNTNFECRQRCGDAAACVQAGLFKHCVLL
jgi:hypothetical protein